MIGRLRELLAGGVAERRAGHPGDPRTGVRGSKQFWNGRATLLLGFVPGGVERYFVPRPGTEAKAADFGIETHAPEMA